MSLQPGSRLGPYEIESALGAGGMGEVYRARDSRLGRHVAIKSLPAAFAQDPERVARFKREAQLLAALNHPHIAGIHGLEEANGSQFLVLEFVDGETLADRLAKGPIPLAESLRIAREIIDALEAAHEKGIIHRDLKPGNVALTADGQVKVLDFGLARYEAGDSGSTPDLTASPTLAYAGTQAGIILGTAAYMSPEQAKGRPVDKRTDVWAFGCVFFEMLTGRKAFEGQDVADTLAAILRSEPEWAALPADVPPALRTVIKRCLERERRARIPDFSVVRFLIDDAGQPSPSMTPRDHQAASGRSTLLPWLAAGAFATMGVVALWAPWRHTPSPASIRVSAELGGDTSFAARFQSLALSPDGTTIAFVGEDNLSTRHLFIRRLDQFQASALAGTDGALMPFFSPDGQWVAFSAGQKLKKVAVSGGAVVTLCDLRSSSGGFWGDDGTITFAETSLQRVSASGGLPTPLTALAPGEGMARWPVMLPGGRAVLYSSLGAGRTDWDSGEIVVRKLPDGPRTVLQKNAYFGRYSRSGHILYVQRGTVFAAPFDLEKLEIVGPAVPAAEDVMSLGANGSAEFAISDTGVAAYVSGASASSIAPTFWLDQTGKTTTLRATASNWSSPSFSPDGTRLAMDISDGVQTDIWIYDWARDTMSRLTSNKADDGLPSWSPDGRRIAFVSKRSEDGGQEIYWQRADGAGDAQQLTHTLNTKRGGSFHPSGKFFAYAEQQRGAESSILVLPIDGDEASGWKPGTARVLVSAAAFAGEPMFSPDGHWLAYISSESGGFEIYVIPFPGPGGKTQISNGEGYDPTWSRVKHELFYASSAGANAFRVMRLPYKVDGESFQADKPQRWSEGVFAARPRAPSRDFDLHPDGLRVVVAPVENGNTKIEKVSLLFNFFDELKRLTAKK